MVDKGIRVIEKVLKLAACGLVGLVLSLGLGASTANAQASSSSQAAPAPTTPPADTPQQRTTLTTGKLAAAAPVTYDNRYELYGGINLQNFQAGQNLPKRMNFGGVEVQGTYWLTGRLGLAADLRGEAGTTPVNPNPYTVRPLVVMYIGMGGVQYRGYRSQRFAIDYHGFAGAAHGDFTETPLPPGETVGLYTNRTAPMFAVGGSLDFNRSKNLALRLSPDLIFEHFGTETREFFSISGGVVYRLGKR